MVSFIDTHRAAYGVESVCAQLPIAPSQYYEAKAREAQPERLPPRLKRDRVMRAEIRRVYDENFHVYGARKVWRQLGLQGVVRGRKCRTTIADDRAERPLDRVNRQSQASRPDQLWVADNALAECIIGLYKTEVIHPRGPWRHLEAVEYATLEWVDCFNHRHLLEPIGNVPPAELDASYHQSTGQLPMAARLKPGALRKNRGGSLTRIGLACDRN